MTVNSNETRAQYTALASQTIFVYDWTISNKNDLEVFLTPVGQEPDPATDLLTVDVNYTVTGVGDPDGGTIVLVVPATAGDIITIYGDEVIERLTDFNDGGLFTPGSLDNGFNKLTRIAKQLKTRADTRQLTYEITDQLSTSDTVLPKLAASQYWKKNSAGKLVAVTDEECNDCSTLRSELASETSIAPGAELVGFYEPSVGSTNTDLMLKSLLTRIEALEESTNTTGTTLFTIETTAPSGWLIMDDGTIGNAASGATTRANADTEDLFTLLWDNISDTYAPVSSGRGASAAADFAANKTISLFRSIGRALAAKGSLPGISTFTTDYSTNNELLTVPANVIDSFIYPGTKIRFTTSGTLPSPLATGTDYLPTVISGTTLKVSTSNANFADGTYVTLTDDGTGTHSLEIQVSTFAMGQYYGEFSHRLINEELTIHDHEYVSLNGPSNATGSPGGTFRDTLISSFCEKTGGSESFNIIQPSTFLNVKIKL